MPQPGLQAVQASPDPYKRPDDWGWEANADQGFLDHPAVAQSPPVSESQTEISRPEWLSEYGDGFHEFSGAEVRVQAYVGGRGTQAQAPIDLDRLVTISYSVFREKYQVKAVGSSNAKGYSRGTRTIGGTLIFSHGHEDPLLPLLRTNHVRTTYSGSYKSDELLPFDLSLVFLHTIEGPHGGVNVLSRLWLRGLEINNESLTVSIQQTLTQKPLQFTAIDVEPMHMAGTELPGRGMERIGDPVGNYDESPEFEFQFGSESEALQEQESNSLEGAKRFIERRELSFESSQDRELRKTLGRRWDDDKRLSDERTLTDVNRNNAIRLEVANDHRAQAVFRENARNKSERASLAAQRQAQSIKSLTYRYTRQMERTLADRQAQNTILDEVRRDPDAQAFFRREQERREQERQQQLDRLLDGSAQANTDYFRARRAGRLGLPNSR